MLFVDLLVELARGPGRWPLLLVLVLGVAARRSLHGLLITRLRLQPFIVTLCGLLIYRGVARFYHRGRHRGASAPAFRRWNG